MAQLPADRTKLAQAQSNMNPSLTASSQKLKDALTEAYDTIDTLNQKVDNHGSNATLPHPDKSVIRAKLADKVVGAGQLDDAAVGQSHHQDNGIPSRALPDNVILQRHMSDNSVGSAELQAGAVTATKIPNGTINSQHIDAALLASSASLSTQAEFDKRGISLGKYSNLVVNGYWTAAFSQALQDALATGIKKILLPDGVLKGNFRITTSGITLVGNGLNTILTNDDDKPTLQLESSDGTNVRECIIGDFTIQHSGTGGGLLISGSRNNFSNIKFDACYAFGLKFKNRLDGCSLNKFVNCLYYRCRGEGGIVIPPNGADSSYANGNMFANCDYDRFFSGDGNYVPTIDCGTSATFLGGWIQAKHLSGIKVRGTGAKVRLVGVRMDSSSATDTLIEFVDGATLTNVQCAGSDIDGNYVSDGLTKQGNTLNGTFSLKFENGKIVRYFTTSDHEFTDLGGVREEGIKMGINRLFFTSGDPTTVFATRTHIRGDFAIRSNSGSNTQLLYTCTVSGTPGTWAEIHPAVPTNISGTPSFIGQLAVVGGIGYMAIGTTSSTDWKQVTN